MTAGGRGRRHALLRTLALGVALAAGGCASLAPAPTPANTLAGRISVRVTAPATVPGEPPTASGSTSLFELVGSEARGRFTLSSTLGTTLVQAVWAADGVRLATADGERRFPSLEALAQELLGEPLPLGALFDWLRGRPSTRAPSTPLAGGRGFEQLGWRVDLGRFDEGRIRIDRDGASRVELRIALEPLS